MNVRSPLAVLALAALASLGPSVTAQAASDTTPPQVSLNDGLAFQVGTILGDTTPNPLIGPVSVTFTASDNTGIASLDALANIFDHTATNVGTYEVNDDPAVRAMTPTVALNGEVDAQVSAYDAAGNLGADFATYYPKLYQQSVFTLGTGWRGGRRAAWSGGTLVHSAKAGATATYTFTGRSVALIGDYGPDRGSARVSVDGTVVATVNTNGFTSNRAVVFTKRFSANQTHTLKVVAVSSARFDIDAVIIQD